MRFDLVYTQTGNFQAAVSDNRASDSHAYGSTDDVKMGFEQNNNASQVNAQLAYRWDVVTTGAETFYLQGQAMVTDSANHSLQCDTNGRPELGWERIN